MFNSLELFQLIFRLDGTSTDSPVLGLRAVLGFVVLAFNIPKPLISTLCPEANWLDRYLKILSTVFSISAFKIFGYLDCNS